MFNFFKNKKSDNSSAPAPASSSTPNTTGNIVYSAGLVAQLQRDHKAILELYGRIDIAFERREVKEIAELLKQFKAGLQDHLLAENVRLYAYLEQLLKDDVVNAEIIADFRREMNGIAHEVMKFLKKYSDIADNQTLTSTFKADFDAIGKVLVERINREESLLYPLYVPRT